MYYSDYDARKENPAGQTTECRFDNQLDTFYPTESASPQMCLFFNSVTCGAVDSSYAYHLLDLLHVFAVLPKH